MRVLIADDSVLLREGLARLIPELGHEVVGTVGDGPSLVTAVEALEPDLALVDVRMPPNHRDDGLVAAIEARRRRPGTAVLVLSQYVEESYAAELLADGRGGAGYLLKDRVEDLDTLESAINTVAAGGTVLDPEVVAQLFVQRRTDDPLDRLTAREREVLSWMAEGRSNPAIAELLVVSGGAVEKHIGNIFSKLDLMPSGDDHRRVLAVLAFLRSR